MKRSAQAEVEEFQHELESYRATVSEECREFPDKAGSFLYKQINFRVESARFCITELGIWAKLDEQAKYKLTREKLQDILTQLDEMVTEFVEDGTGELDGDDEDE